MTTIIENCPCISKQEWVDYYYDTGIQRHEAIAKLDKHTADKLQNRLLKETDPESYQYMKYELKSLNYNHGRRKEDLHYKSEVLHHHAKKQIANLSIEDAIAAVQHRVIGETWNGIIIREKNTVAAIQKLFPSIRLHKTTGTEDHKFAVDYGVCLNDNLICGIQIKPKSYTYNTPYILKAKAANAMKNQLYSDTYGVPVIDVISDYHGKILNGNCLVQIRELCGH